MDTSHRYNLRPTRKILYVNTVDLIDTDSDDSDYTPGSESDTEDELEEILDEMQLSDTE